MWAIAGILAAGAGIAFLEAPLLIKEKRKKDLWVFFILLFIALGLSIAKSLQVPLPNPLDWLTALYKPISDVVFSWLE